MNAAQLTALGPAHQHSGRRAAPGRGFARRVCWLLVVGGFLAVVAVERRIDAEWGIYGKLAEILYIPSGSILRRASLGHEGLLADIYWTRAVQYFGRKRLAREARYDLLGQLLRITTTLDPHLLIAYRFGAIFLAEKPPTGAGQPEEALQLIRRGIAANPDYWRLWQDLGFIYYWELKDYRMAARIFRVGSERPGAAVWMKVMAAKIAAEGGEAGTSRLLWQEIYRQAGNDDIRRSALDHLAALDAQQAIDGLNKLLARYRAPQGREARSFRELVQAGLLPGIPVDPSGVPYALGPDGRATLAPESRIKLWLLQ